MNARRLVGLGAGLILLATAGAACSKEVATAEVGDCIEDVNFFGGIDELPTTDCDQDHDAQVVGVFDHDGDDFPGEEEIGEEAQERCAELFEDFVGAPVQETSLSFGTINPTEETWNEADDRETICVANTRDGSQLDQSVEDAAEDFEAEAGSGGGSGGGEEQDFSALVEDCEGGDMAACDDLYFATPVGSEEEEIGATCGGESDEPLNGGCEAEFG